MEFTEVADFERCARGVLDCTFPKAKWTHAAHFAAVLWLLREQPNFASPFAIRQLIMSYNEATATPNTDSGGYHHTITLASLQAARWYLGDHAPGSPLPVVHRAIMQSRLGRPDWLLAHWHSDTLFSVAARRDWVEPDLQALPFDAHHGRS